MNAATGQTGNPFTARTALVLVLGGAALFLALLWMIGAGLASGSANDGGGHGAGRGLNGFAGFSRLLQGAGYDVRESRSEAAFGEAGLLVLTPPHDMAPADIDRILSEHGRRGPTLLILPKWQAVAIPENVRPASAKRGWVMLGGAAVAPWTGKLNYTGPLDARIGAEGGQWFAPGLAGSLPDKSAVQSVSSGRFMPVVRDERDQVLAAMFDSGDIGDGEAQPLMIVAEPDLLDNYGMARERNAALALALIGRLTGGNRMPVAFDLTLNGYARQTNLLTLAFTPPFLAATLCLVLAAIAIMWRAFLRFGAPARAARAIAFGKAALVANAAGLMRRTRRLHLLTGPYADRAREHVSRALAIPRQTDRDAAERAIDRALAARDPDAPAFSEVAARLRIARGPHAALGAAQDLHALERKLTG